MILNIVTPSIRPENIESIGRAIEEYNAGRFEINWLIVFDLKPFDFKPSFPFIRHFFHQSTDSIKGIAQCNFALDYLSEGFMWFCADDNKPHELFFDRMFSIINQNPDKLAFVFNEERIGKPYPRAAINGVLYAKPENVKPAKIDGSQYLIHTAIIGNNKLKYTKTADGDFIEAIYKEWKDDFMFINETLAYFEGLNGK